MERSIEDRLEGVDLMGSLPMLDFDFNTKGNIILWQNKLENLLQKK